MVNNTSLLGYSEWVRINESAQPDAVYFTVKFVEAEKLPSTNELLMQAIQSVAERYSNHFKLDSAYPDKFTISLSEEESFDVFSEVGATEPIEIKLLSHKFRPMTYAKITECFDRTFTSVMSNTKQLTHTYSLKKEEFDLTDDEIIDKVIHSKEFSRNTSYNQLSLEKAEAFLATPENIEKAFLTPDKDARGRYIELLDESLTTMVYVELQVIIIGHAKPFERRPVHLDQLSVVIKDRLTEFRKRISSYSQASNEEELRQLVIDMSNYQRELARMLGSSDVRRKAASAAIVQTYDMFSDLGISDEEALKLIGK